MAIKQMESKFENNPIPEIQEDVIKQQLERNKEFAVLEVIEQLEKENEELKKQVKMSVMANYIAFQMESKETIAELKTQIEKMKCCGNCRYFTGEKCTYAYRDVNYNDNCETWDLAE